MSSFEVGADMPTEITIAQLSRLIGLPGAPVLAMCAQSQRVTRAAEELGVSQVAVSQQVKSLEATLGLKLFARDGKRLVIRRQPRLTANPEA